MHGFVAESGAHDLMVINGIPGTFDFAEVDLHEVAALPGVADSQRASWPPAGAPRPVC